MFETSLIFQVFREIKVKDFDASKFEQKQVFFPSKDGTKIPMFIVHKKVRAVKYSQTRLIRRFSIEFGRDTNLTRFSVCASINEQVRVERRRWCMHPGFKTHGQSQPKPKTESASGSTKWWLVTAKIKKKKKKNIAFFFFRTWTWMGTTPPCCTVTEGLTSRSRPGSVCPESSSSTTLTECTQWLTWGVVGTYNFIPSVFNTTSVSHFLRKIWNSPEVLWLRLVCVSHPGWIGGCSCKPTMHPSDVNIFQNSLRPYISEIVQF